MINFQPQSVWCDQCDKTPKWCDKGGVITSPDMNNAKLFVHY